jgi:hypothetical protein
MRVLRRPDDGLATWRLSGLLELPARSLSASYPRTGGMRTLDAIFWLVIMLMALHVAELVLLLKLLSSLAGH